MLEKNFTRYKQEVTCNKNEKQKPNLVCWWLYSASAAAGGPAWQCGGPLSPAPSAQSLQPHGKTGERRK